MAAGNRPLSPHLQVYKPQLTSVMSITHRATGLLLALGLVALSYWLAAVAAGGQAYAGAVAFFGGWPGTLLVVLWTAAVSYHLLNGIRHLFWDAGLGFELSQVYRSGWAVVIGTVLVTCLALVALLAGGGA